MKSVNLQTTYRIISIILIAILVSVFGCENGSEYVSDILDEAELLMESKPDSALSLLNSIESASITKKSQKARYALLKSMALDKNYIDTANFDVLQPAIDYYLQKGTPDEKLRTYYYQGRIYQNRNDRDSALHAFIKGIDNSSICHDSLTIARTLVAQGYLYKNFYDINSYINNYLKAAQIYENKRIENYEFDCLLNALNGMIVLGKEEQADSIIKIIRKFDLLEDSEKQILKGFRLAYILRFGSKQDLKIFIDKNLDSVNYNVIGILNLSAAYARLGEYTKALQLVNYLDDNRIGYDTLKYLSIKYQILDEANEYKEALSTYKDYILKLESINSSKFEQKSQSVAEKHQMELQAERESRKNLQIIYGCIGGILLLLMSLVIMGLLFRSNKAKRNLAIQIAKTTELENEQLKSEKDIASQKARMAELENANLRSERERLTLENRNLQLERDNKTLEAENLAHRVETLEGESESLKALLETSEKEDIPSEVQQAIRTRIEMLNSLLAGYITDNSQYEKPYDAWVKEITEDTEAFMSSNRLAFQASHPRFIRYFEEHGLTESEINYVCLYAIGLRGKEVGSYMKKRSHVNISSAIRKKLGIDKHDTNIGIYVRKLLKGL